MMDVPFGGRKKESFFYNANILWTFREDFVNILKRFREHFVNEIVNLIVVVIRIIFPKIVQHFFALFSRFFY